MTMLAAAILHGYAGIRLRQKNLLLTAFCAVTHVTVTVLYCGTFSRAYRLTELQKKLKLQLIATCGKLPPGLKKENLKALNALSCPGLKVGSFQEMERQSALIFTDFVEKQLISLLVAL